MSKTFKVPESTRMVACTPSGLFFSACCFYWAERVNAVKVTTLSLRRTCASCPGPLPPPQEQLLTPIPRQFDWMRRTVRPNPVLESLLRLREVTPHLLMSISLTEEYSDNFFLSASDPQDVYRTSLNLGTVYRVESGRGFVSLANSIRGSYDAGAGQGTFAFANLSLNTGYELPRLSLSLSESFLRSDEPQDATPVGVQRQRRPFSTNIVSPQFRYALTPTTTLNGAYTSTLVWNDSVEQDNTVPSTGNLGGSVGNSVTNAFSTGLQHCVYAQPQRRPGLYVHHDQQPRLWRYPSSLRHNQSRIHHQSQDNSVVPRLRNADRSARRDLKHRHLKHRH